MLESNIKIGETWETRDGRKVLVRCYIKDKLYPIVVKDINTNEVYTVSREGLWEIYYAYAPSSKDLVYRVN